MEEKIDLSLVGVGLECIGYRVNPDNVSGKVYMTLHSLDGREADTFVADVATYCDSQVAMQAGTWLCNMLNGGVRTAFLRALLEAAERLEQRVPRALSTNDCSPLTPCRLDDGRTGSLWADYAKKQLYLVIPDISCEPWDADFEPFIEALDSVRYDKSFVENPPKNTTRGGCE